LKVSTNAKIAMQCFENFWGANASNAPLVCAPGFNDLSIQVQFITLH